MLVPVAGLLQEGPLPAENTKKDAKNPYQDKHNRMYQNDAAGTVLGLQFFSMFPQGQCYQNKRGYCKDSFYPSQQEYAYTYIHIYITGKCKSHRINVHGKPPFFSSKSVSKVFQNIHILSYCITLIQYYPK